MTGGVVHAGNPTGAVSDELLASLIHDAEVEAGERDGDGCDLSMREYDEGVLAALRELKVRRG